MKIARPMPRHVMTVRLPRTPIRVRNAAVAVEAGAKAARTEQPLGSWGFFALAHHAETPREKREIAAAVAAMPDRLSEILGDTPGISPHTSLESEELAPA
jgi:hypothetical protein